MLRRSFDMLPFTESLKLRKLRSGGSNGNIKWLAGKLKQSSVPAVYGNFPGEDKVGKRRCPLVQGFVARSGKVPAKPCTSFFVCALCLWAAEKFITRQSG